MATSGEKLAAVADKIERWRNKLLLDTDTLADLERAIYSLSARDSEEGERKVRLTIKAELLRVQVRSVGIVLDDIARALE